MIMGADIFVLLFTLGMFLFPPFAPNSLTLRQVARGGNITQGSLTQNCKISVAIVIDDTHFYIFSSSISI